MVEVVFFMIFFSVVVFKQNDSKCHKFPHLQANAFRSSNRSAFADCLQILRSTVLDKSIVKTRNRSFADDSNGGIAFLATG